MLSDVKTEDLLEELAGRFDLETPRVIDLIANRRDVTVVVTDTSTNLQQWEKGHMVWFRGEPGRIHRMLIGFAQNYMQGVFNGHIARCGDND